MTEMVYTHKPAAMHPHARRVFTSEFRSAASLQAALNGFAADTHEFLNLHMPAGVLRGLFRSGAGVHAYPQGISANAPRHASRAAIAMCRIMYRQGTASVYTYKQQQSSQLGQPQGAVLQPAVYTYKQQTACRAPTSGPAGGRLPPPPAVYTHKHPQPNPAQSGVRCVWGQITGEPQ